MPHRTPRPRGSDAADSVRSTVAGRSHDDCSTLDVARELGLAVRSVQLMVDRGELQAWRTPGGHRRISRRSVEAWVAARQGSAAPRATGPEAAHGMAHGTADAAVRATPRATPRAQQARPPRAAADTPRTRPRVLLIEDSRHYQNLVALLLAQRFPQVELHRADDGIAGLALAGQLQPDVLLVDILLPGIDGATLITGLRSHAAFRHSRLIVVTSLDGDDLAPYAFALDGVPVVHKSALVTDLPLRLAEALAALGRSDDPALGRSDDPALGRTEDPAPAAPTRVEAPPPGAA